MNLESLQSRRTWIVGGLAVAILLVAASWLMVIHPKLSSASDTRSQADNTDLQNAQLVAKNGKLEEQQRNIANLRNGLTAALAELPPTTALPEFTHELTQTAAADGVTLTNIGVGTLTAVGTPVVATPAPAASSSSTTSGDSSSTATEAAPATGTTPAATQYQLSVTLMTSGTLSRQLAFAKDVEDGARRALITSTSFNGLGDKTVMTTQLNIFTAPLSTGQVAQLHRLLTSAG